MRGSSLVLMLASLFFGISCRTTSEKDSISSRSSISREECDQVAELFEHGSFDRLATRLHPEVELSLLKEETGCPGPAISMSEEVHGQAQVQNWLEFNGWKRWRTFEASYAASSHSNCCTFMSDVDACEAVRLQQLCFDQSSPHPRLIRIRLGESSESSGTPETP
jgi:hypothetical protein